MKSKINFLIAFSLLLVISLGCNFSVSTANLDEIKFDKDKSGSNSKTNFNPNDEIFAISGVNNASGKNKVNFRLLFDNVEGAKSGTVAYKIEKEMETQSDQKIWLNFGVPGGFVPGSYKFEVVLKNEDGKELDRKTATFSISGDGSGKTNKPENTSENDTDEADEDK